MVAENQRAAHLEKGDRKGLITGVPMLGRMTSIARPASGLVCPPKDRSLPLVDTALDDSHVTSEPVTLERIERESAPILGNLLELYAHDFSEILPLTLRESGRFDLSFGDAWWTRDDHFPFFIRVGGRLAGFALVRRGSRLTASDDVMDVAEFFVIRGVRRLGVGTRAAHAVFARFPGSWEVRVRRANAPAMKFWARALEGWLGRAATSGSLSFEGVDWNVFRIDPPRG